MDGATGTTLFELDVIHICSVNFQSKSINAGSPVGAQITRDETKIGSFDASVSNTFVHEFTHWHGSANSGDGTERTVTRECTLIPILMGDANQVPRPSSHSPTES